MSLNDLFATNTTVRLTSDTNSWSDQIISSLLNKFPTLSKLVGEITFAKIDAIKGNAVGYISLIGKPHQRIPFIVDQMELNPLDLYIDNTMYLPLTENTIKRIQLADWPFRLLSQQERTGLLKVASSLFSEDTGELKNDFINSHKVDLAKIATEYPEVIEKYAVQNIPEEVKEQSIVHYFVKEAASERPIVASNMKEPDKYYKVSEIAKMFGSDFVTKLMNEKHIIWSNLPPTAKLKLQEKEVHAAYKPSTTNVGFVKQDGELVAAKRFEHYQISTLEKRYSLSSTIIITKNGVISQDGTGLYNLDVPKTIDFTFTLDQPKVGDLAGLVYGDKFYGPFYIEGIANIVGEKVITILDNELRQIRLRFTDDIKSIVPLDENQYLVSNFVQCIPITPANSNGTTIDMLKQASAKVVVTKQLNGKHMISDGGLSGINLNNLQNLKKHDATVVLMNCGLSENDARYALMLANDKGSYAFEPGMSKKAEAEKDTSLEKIANEIVQKCDESELLKVAVITGDKSNIDLALGLNLITYNNIKRFKLAIPEIYQMLDRLCKLLIVKRMNRSLVMVDDSQLTQAIFALDDIATSLGSL